ncbi:MAG: hypothetical protein ISN28_07400 [Ectothiorhodospiraceae bacterium AqS1]|nr:hypothetical protein [Ectothiorhodospiraceae bacterium AqS1]
MDDAEAGRQQLADPGAALLGALLAVAVVGVADGREAAARQPELHLVLDVLDREGQVALAAEAGEQALKGPVDRLGHLEPF